VILIKKYKGCPYCGGHITLFMLQLLYDSFRLRPKARDVIGSDVCKILWGYKLWGRKLIRETRWIKGMVSFTGEKKQWQF